jgi:fibronectin type 3 domain-containing protein
MKTSKVGFAFAGVLVAAAIALFAYLGPLHAHSVTLHWAPTEGATSYNVYRGKNSGGPYEMIGSASSPTYVDKEVSSGEVLYYVVTAVKNGQESRHSAEIKAVVP